MVVSNRLIRIGSRKSQLALVQTYWIQEQLQKHYPNYEFQIETMSTQGDNILDVALAKIGDKGLFTKELEVAMLQNRIDFAVHSLKDLPTNLPEGLMLGCITEREDPADALVVNEKYKNNKLDTLPEGSIIGTSSLRRLAQLRHHYPYLIFKDVRGNVNTRLAKLDAGEYDAIILAAAGLKRLNMDNRIHQIIPEDISLHAVGQGALGIECRAADSRILELLEVLKHSETHYRCMGERSFLRALEGGCQVPIGVTTKIECNILTLTGIVASLDGKTMLKNTVSGHMEQAENLGYELSVCLRDAGATEILDKIFSETRIQ